MAKNATLPECQCTNSALVDMVAMLREELQEQNAAVSSMRDEIEHGKSILHDLTSQLENDRSDRGGEHELRAPPGEKHGTPPNGDRETEGEETRGTGIHSFVQTLISGVRNTAALLPSLPTRGVPRSIGFTVVSLKEFGPVTMDTNIPFEEVSTNDGNGWKPDGNYFEAPVKGLYFFTASIHSDWAGGASADIVQLGKRGQGTRKLVSLRASSNNGNTNQVLVHLDPGDRVSARLLPCNCRLFSHPDFVYSAFSGILMTTS